MSAKISKLMGNSPEICRRHYAALVPEDMTLYNIAPHMHMLGREMKVWATLPDRTKRELIWLNDWDFNWQESYVFKEPLRLPKGTKIELLATYENSVSNPRNPHRPTRRVMWGEASSDEMCVVFFGLTRDAEQLGIQPAPPSQVAVVTSGASASGR